MAACQPATPAAALPTLASLPTALSRPPAATATATVTPAATATTTTTATTTVTVTPSATLTDTPPASAPLMATVMDTDTVTVTPAATATLLPEAFVFGQSVEGRDLTAYRFGSGPRLLLLVGGIHTGYETNTVGLLRALRDHYTARPDEVLPGVALVLVPALNPDGLLYGRALRGRFNAREVDLNRNWGCGWSAAAVFRDLPVNAGAAPFSEPETVALGALIQQLQPGAVLFYHAAARGVFPGNCGGTRSVALAQVYSAASGYPYQPDFAGYTVTGSAPNWVDSLGIPALDVELASAEDTELIRNLNAIRAVQAWLTATTP